ncbi:MAG: hypothetical protein ACLR7U_14045 [Ruthenibacterium lactatiformans]
MALHILPHRADLFAGAGRGEQRRNIPCCRNGEGEMLPVFTVRIMIFPEALAGKSIRSYNSADKHLGELFSSTNSNEIFIGWKSNFCKDGACSCACIGWKSHAGDTRATLSRRSARRRGQKPVADLAGHGDTSWSAPATADGANQNAAKRMVECLFKPATQICWFRGKNHSLFPRFWYCSCESQPC